MKEDAKKFLAELEKGEREFASLKEIAEKADDTLWAEKLIPQAEKLGYHFTAEELSHVLAESDDNVLDDDDLDGISGGYSIFHPLRNPNYRIKKNATE